MAPIDDPKYDIFYTEQADKDTSSNYDLIKTPLEALDNKGNIRFHIPASNSYWMDLSHAHIDFEARIVHSDGKIPHATTDPAAKPPTTKKTIAFINNGAHSVFSDVKMTINETIVAGGDGNYHLIAYMHNLLQYTHGVKSTVKITEGYHNPSMDNTSKEFDDWEHTTNQAISQAVNGGKWIKLTLPLRTVPILNQDKALPPGKSVNISLTRNDPKFAIWTKDKGEEYDFEIRNMYIRIPMIRPSPTIQAQIAEKSRNNKASFYYPNLRVFRYNIAKGTTQKDLFNIFQGQPVKLGFFALMPSSYYNDQSKRKFIFKKHGLSEIELRTEGRSVSGKPLNVADVCEAYRHFNREFNLYSANDDIGINLDEFEKYCNIWPFDCTLGGNIDARQDGGENKRTYDLMLKFKSPSGQSLDVLCFFVTDERFILGPGNEVISADYAK